MKNSPHAFLRVRCGHCIYCKLYRRSNWSIRLEMESHYWTNKSFLTLTYDDEHLPLNTVDGRLYYSEKEIEENPELEYLYYPTLRPRDLSLFLKRLRKHRFGEEHDYRTYSEGRYNVKRRIGFRYFSVGEYGSLKGRSHLHLLLFGVAPTPENASKIREIWGNGHIRLDPFFPETCKYVAGYVQKKLYGDKEELIVRLPEFMRCSQGIGIDWLYDHQSLFDDEHPFIPYKGKDGKSYPHGLPPRFRKFLVDNGRLRPICQDELWRLQMEDWHNFSSYCLKNDIDFADYFRARKREAEHVNMKVNKKRNLTGDI